MSFSNTQDEEVLAARAEYKKLYAKYSDEVKELAEKVREAGGLYIIGTERHESRRIDNQLREDVQAVRATGRKHILPLT